MNKTKYLMVFEIPEYRDQQEVIDWLEDKYPDLEVIDLNEMEN